MREVRAPSSFKPRLERLFAFNEASISRLQTALSAARRRDAGGVATGLLRFRRVRDQVHVLAVGFGIDCDPN